MHYYVGRYLQGLRKMRRWLPLVFLPPAVYLLAAAATPDMFSVTQGIAVYETTPMALSKTPVDFTPMAEIVSRPSELFLDDFALLDLAKHSELVMPGPRESGNLHDLKRVIEACMTLKPVSSGKVRLGYFGPDAERGKFFVNYFSQRLVSRSRDGIVRSSRNLSRTSPIDAIGASQFPPQKSAGPEPRFLPATIEGELQVQAHRTLWRQDRLLLSMAFLMTGLAFWFIAAGVVEWADPSFKSERQVSRYLNVPVIGVMPDLVPLVQRLKPKNPSP